MARKFSKSQKIRIIVNAIIGAEETLVVSEGEKYAERNREPKSETAASDIWILLIVTIKKITWENRHKKKKTIMVGIELYSQLAPKMMFESEASPKKIRENSNG